MAFYQTPVFLIGTTENLKCWTTGLWRHHLECLETHSLTSSLSTYKLEVLNGHAATPSTRLPCTEHYSMFWHKPWDIFMITFLFLVHSEVCEEETSSWCWQYTKYQTCHTIHHLDSCSLYIFTQVWSILLAPWQQPAYLIPKHMHGHFLFPMSNLKMESAGMAFSICINVFFVLNVN